MKKIRLGIIGCGAMGSAIARACQEDLCGHISLKAICDIDSKKARRLKSSLKPGVSMLDIKHLIKESDLVVEASSAIISGEILAFCVREKRDCLIMSVGGLIGREGLINKALKSGIGLYIPSGAIAGIDALKAACVGKVFSVRLTTRKPVMGLDGAPYLIRRKIDIKKIKKETVVFEGDVPRAIKGFPQNINVSAVLSIAGIGAKKTKVRIIASPDYCKNIHEVEIEGEAGRIFTRTENVPSKDNPKTSALAINSAIALLDSLKGRIRVGT